MAAVSLRVNDFKKTEPEWHGKLGHNLVWIKHIASVIRTDICYTDYHLATQTMVPNLPSFQGIKICLKYLTNHKIFLYCYNSYKVSNVIRLT